MWFFQYIFNILLTFHQNVMFQFKCVFRETFQVSAWSLLHLPSSALRGSSCCEDPKGCFSSEYIDLFLSCHLIHLTFCALECTYHLLFAAAINNVKRISVSRCLIHTYAMGSAGFTKHLSTQHLEFSLCFHLKKQLLLQMVFSRQSGIQLFKLLQAIIVVLSIVHFINVEYC